MGIMLPENPIAAFHKSSGGVAEPMAAGFLHYLRWSRSAGPVRLRGVAVCGQVGHYSRGDGAEAVWVLYARTWRGGLR